jgi:glycosyltransferase involved in cell wall biosynthesis
MGSTSERPLVTIITPTYNRAGTLGRALDSVLAQDYPNWDLVVVDDGSTDDTAEVLAAYHDSRIRVVEHDRNRGVAAAKNTGLDNIRGEFYSTLDSDDELRPNALSRLLAVFAEHPEVDQVICNVEDPTTGGPGGRGMDAEGYVDEASVVFVGEHWSLTRTASLGDERHNPALKGFEEVLWYKLAEHQRRYFITDCLRVLHPDAGDRVSQEGRGARYSSFVALLDTEPEHLERLARKAPEVRARFWFDAGVEFCWVGDKARARLALSELQASGAATPARVGLLRFGLAVGPGLFRPTVRAILAARHTAARVRP